MRLLRHAIYLLVTRGPRLPDALVWWLLTWAVRDTAEATLARRRYSKRKGATVLRLTCPNHAPVQAQVTYAGIRYSVFSPLVRTPRLYVSRSAPGPWGLSVVRRLPPVKAAYGNSAQGGSEKRK